MDASVSPAADPPRTPTKSPPHKKKKRGSPKKDKPKPQQRKRKGKSDRDKLVERLMYQNMRIYEMMEKNGIMDHPKDLTSLDRFIKQGTGCRFFHGIAQLGQ